MNGSNIDIAIFGRTPPNGNCRRHLESSCLLLGSTPSNSNRNRGWKKNRLRTLTFFGALGVDDFGGRVSGTDETRELSFVGLVGADAARLASFRHDVEVGADGAEDTTFALSHAARRAVELRLAVAELHREDVQIETAAIFDVEQTVGQSRLGQVLLELVQVR